MKYVKTYEQLKDFHLTNDYYFWVSNDDKYILLNGMGKKSNAYGEYYGEHMNYYGVYPIDKLYEKNTLFAFYQEKGELALAQTSKVKLDVWLKVADIYNKMPIDYTKDGLTSLSSHPSSVYEKTKLTIDDFKEIKYLQGIHLADEEYNL